MTVLHIDVETFSELDIKTVGAYAYSQHHSTEVLCMSYSWDKGPTVNWHPDSFGDYSTFPEDVMHHLENGGTYTAHNASFEWCILKHVLNITTYPEQIRDTMFFLSVRTLPRGLGDGAKYLGTHLKDEEGKKIMMQLCRPRTRVKGEKTTKTRWLEEEWPDKYQALYDYCDDDVNAQKGIYYGLPRPTVKEQRLYELMFQANIDGLPIDVEACNAMIKVIEDEQTLLVEECIEITGYSPTQRANILEWLQERIEIDNLQAATVDNLLLKDPKELPPNVHRVLWLRRMGGKSSTAKYYKFLETMGKDQCVHFTMIAHGAKTGRSTGADAQTANLPRPTIDNIMDAVHWLTVDPDVIALTYDSVMDVASSAIRSMICAPKGYGFRQGDYSQIEARTLAWGAGQIDSLERFRRGEDPYIGLASTIYHVPEHMVTSLMRQIAKSAVLGAGFQMGGNAFVSYCAQSGVIIDEKEARNVIQIFREANPEIVSFWYAMEAAAIEAVENKGRRVKLDKVLLASNSNFLSMKLPSGRCIHWYKPQVRDDKTPWGDPCRKLSFIGKARNSNFFGRRDTYGGDLVQSWTQATARDILMDAWTRASEQGWDVRLTVYDELLCMEPDGGRSHEELCALMVDSPAWARGLPIAADGWTGQRYRK